MALLQIQDLCKHFGGLAANQDISFDVAEGELVGVIGPNGAGKTTLFNCITGYHTPTSGRIVFLGKDITGFPPHKNAALGLARTFQVYTAGGDLTVCDHIMVGCFLHTGSRTKARKSADELMDVFNLKKYANVQVGELPTAGQKLAVMAGAMGTKPKLLMLDEVAAGLNPGEIEEIIAVIRRIHGEMGVNVMLIEHILEMVMSLSNKVVVLDYGQVIASGTPEEIAGHPDVIRAYLGERYARQIRETQGSA